MTTWRLNSVTRKGGQDQKCQGLAKTSGSGVAPAYANEVFGKWAEIREKMGAGAWCSGQPDEHDGGYAQQWHGGFERLLSGARG
jgi:hypothetical protein